MELAEAHLRIGDRQAYAPEMSRIPLDTLMKI